MSHSRPLKPLPTAICKRQIFAHMMGLEQTISAVVGDSSTHCATATIFLGSMAANNYWQHSCLIDRFLGSPSKISALSSSDGYETRLIVFKLRNVTLMSKPWIGNRVN